MPELVVFGERRDLIDSRAAQPRVGSRVGEIGAAVADRSHRETGVARLGSRPGDLGGRDADLALDTE